MMTDADLETFLKDIESDCVERKESVADGEKIRQAICAFANDLPDHRRPGVIIIGVTDSGACTHQPITDHLLQTLAAMRSDGNILPLPDMTVQKRALSGCEVAVVEVHPANAPPVRFKGIAWIRVGPRRAIATPQEEQRLSEKRRFKDLPFDGRPARDLSLDVLDERLFTQVYLPSAIDAEVLAQNQRSLEHQLTSLRFAHPGPPPCPTNVGVLVVGKSPSDHLPCAYVQFLRIEGTRLTDPIKSSREVRGPLPELLNELDELFKVHITIASDITSQSVEKQFPDYPLVAIQQLARNAIMHRTYEGTNAPVRITWFSNRIEIQNPGGPFGQVNVQNFGQPGITDYRNPFLAEAMRNLTYVQRFGIGIVLARDAMSRNGNPPPRFEVEAGHVAVILEKRS